MTQEQRKQIQKEIETIKEIRNTLDDIMYGSPIIPNDEYHIIRECYECLCNVTDKLYEL